MNQCVICGNKTGFFDVRCADGYLCKDCVACIPSFLNIEKTDSQRLNQFKEENLKKRTLFDATASLGNLYIDNVHKMFCVSTKEKDDKPVQLSDIYSISEIEEFAIYCKNPKDAGNGRNVKVVCDVEFFFQTKDFKFQKIISKNEHCSHKMITTKEIEWHEPVTVSMFRAMFRQMIQDDGNQLVKAVRQIRNSKMIAWAEGVLMMQEDYTIEEVQQHHKFLSEHLKESRKCTEILNQAFAVLKDYKENQE